MVACCSINMRIFKTTELIFLFLFVVWSIEAAPKKSSLDFSSSLEDSSTSTDDEKLKIGDHYDQRQNGTENYRIHVDGLVLVVAPIEGLLLAGGMPDPGDSGIFGTIQQQNEPIVEKPKPDATTDVKPTIAVNDEKPSSGKSSHGTGLRLMSLLSPFLRRAHPHQ